MPATEQTWYDQKQLHVVFGLSSLAMFIATLWMFAADHDREWKGYQRRYREMEQRLSAWRIREAEEASTTTERAQLADALALASALPPSRKLLTDFKEAVLFDAEQRGDLSKEKYNEEFQTLKAWYDGSSEPKGRFKSIDKTYAELEQLSQAIADQKSNLEKAKAEVEKAQVSFVAARKKIDDPATPESDREAIQATIRDAEKALKSAESLANDVNENTEAALAKGKNARASLLSKLQTIVGKAKFREDQLLSRRKFRSADFDAAKANLDLAVRDTKPQEELDRLQGIVDKIVGGTQTEGSLKNLTFQRQKATAHRSGIQSVLRQMTEEAAALDKQIAEIDSDVERLSTSKVEGRSTYFTSSVPWLGKKWLELPILDAFGSPLKIDNLWTDGLMMSNGSFGEVRRFDRCTTCHKGIDKTQAGSAIIPAYTAEQQFDVVIATPSSRPSESDEFGNPLPLDVKKIYGIDFADFGLIDDDDVTVNALVAGGLAATGKSIADAHGSDVAAGIQVGDVILAVNGDKPLDANDARQYLTSGVEWGQPVVLTIRRGLPQPFTSHPRLDLFVGSLSPHSLAVFGCTSCHEGQGSATAFKFASHAPNDIAQENEWSDEHGWFNNHHWIFPMFPERFAESSCLKCHHEVADLEPSSRFPEAPAPKVVEGWHVIGQYGCYGCHEINGYDGPDKRVGPDLRLEPNYFAAAAAVKADPAFAKMDDSIRQLADDLIQRPFENDVRDSLRLALINDKDAEDPILDPYSHKMADVLQHQDSPGTRRKAGPSLRFVASKLGDSFLYDWIREPKNFRPSTKMPQFFGLWDHLKGDDLKLAKDYEKVEILGMVKYLLNNSQDFEYLTAAEGVEPASAERGKVAFEIRGCLACHQHEDFPASESVQGPNLTGLADKFSAASKAPDAQKWLYTWIKRPTHYHARTKMPDLYLNPIKGKDGKTTDPVADIVAYLMGGTKGWEPPAESVAALEVNPKWLNSLAFEHLESTFPRSRAEQYLEEGIPESVGKTLKGAEVELVGSGLSNEQKLMYVGRKAIGKYGCYGCHDIPGFEDAKPIGAALAEWGRKESSKLAFEHILEYLHHGGHGGHGKAHGDDDSDDHAAHGDAHAAHGGNPNAGTPEDAEFFTGQIMAHDRSGFLWQKLREPRSYDYEKTANKKYNDRLRMPLFPITAEQREAVMTFVLGLTASPPADQFVYNPDSRDKAIVEGRRLLEKYNCGGCHILEAEKWELEFNADEVFTSKSPGTYPFLATQFASSDLQKSAAEDKRRGTLTAVLEGMPAISNSDGSVIVLDEEEEELDPDEEYDPETLLHPLVLWKPTALGGEPKEVGVTVTVPKSAIRKRYGTHGGDLTKMLLKRAIELEKKDNPAANGTEAYGWLPPPLVGEGNKVQPEWLHSFLLEPFTIRPAAMLRMPKFNMSPDEAGKIANYFAARDAAQYPYEFDGRLLANHLPTKESKFAEAHGDDKSRLEHAMQIVTNNNYCIKCHLVGDFEPESAVRALAPDLSKVQARLRPEYVRNWIANPTRHLPYTPMPVNIPYDGGSPTLGGVAQEIYPGTSVEQLDALVDLLMNYSEYTSAQHSVTELVGDTKGDAKGNPGSEEAAAVDSKPKENESAAIRQEAVKLVDSQP